MNDEERPRVRVVDGVPITRGRAAARNHSRDPSWEAKPPTPRQAELSEAPHTGRAWWQTCRLEDFRAICETKPIGEVQALQLEVRAAVSLMQSHIETFTGDQTRFIALRKAHGYAVEKSRMAKAILQRRRGDAGMQSKGQMISWRRRRDELIAAAREQLDAGDLRAALSALLDALTIKVADMEPEPPPAIPSDTGE